MNYALFCVTPEGPRTDRKREKGTEVERERGGRRPLEGYLFSLEQHEKKAIEDMTSGGKKRKTKKGNKTRPEDGQRL